MKIHTRVFLFCPTDTPSLIVRKFCIYLSNALLLVLFVSEIFFNFVVLLQNSGHIESVFAVLI